MREYLKGDLTYREMEERYSVASSTIHRWVKESEKASGPAEGLGKGEVRRALVVKRVSFRVMYDSYNANLRRPVCTTSC